MKIMNDIAIYVGWLTMALLCWFIAWCLWQIVKELASNLWWKAKVKTLDHKLYTYSVTMTIIPIDYRKFMISFKCEGYEDWFFYANAKSWKEIGAMASKRWGDYLAEREKAIELAGDPKEIWDEVCKSCDSDGLRSATDA